MRKKVKKRNIVGPDFVYGSEVVEKFINYVMKDGKKTIARKIVYDAFEKIKKQEKTDDPLAVFEIAIKNASPSLEVRSRRIGGANYQIPREVRSERKHALAFRWILEAVRAGKGTDMATRLKEELITASKNEGNAVKKKENTHKMAEANRAFAHFAW